MKKAKWAAIGLMMAMTAGVMLTACSSDEEQQEVAADPDGTVELNMSFYSDSYYSFINLPDEVCLEFRSDSVTFYRCDLLSLGPIDNLSAIQRVPVGPWKRGKEGWGRFAVKPKHGYILRSHDNTVYTRIYVSSLTMGPYIEGAGVKDNRIVEAHVKYQSPWLDYK